MYRFALGFLAVHIVTFIVNIFQLRGAVSTDQWIQYALLIGIIPLLCAWATVKLIVLLRPLRAFDASDQHPVFLPLLGVAAAGVSVLLMALLTAFLSDTMPDWLFSVASSIAATGLAVLTGCRKRLPGCCVRCGYDITHSLAAGRCPECGSALDALA